MIPGVMCVCVTAPLKSVTDAERKEKELFNKDPVGSEFTTAFTKLAASRVRSSNMSRLYVGTLIYKLTCVVQGREPLIGQKGEGGGRAVAALLPS